MTYKQVLADARKAGAVHADDQQLMALFCAGPLQGLVGAVSPQMVWEGAQKRGLTMGDLAALCSDDPQGAADLMWVA